MEIIRNDNKDLIKFKDLKLGDVFIWGDNRIAMKVYSDNEWENAISLETYQVLSIDYQLNVRKLNAKLVTERSE